MTLPICPRCKRVITVLPVCRDCATTTEAAAFPAEPDVKDADE